MDRIMIAIHTAKPKSDIVHSLQTLLLFVLADPRANRPTNPFELVFNPNELMQKQSPCFGRLSDSNLTIEDLIDKLKNPLSKIDGLRLSPTWHETLMKEQTVRFLFFLNSHSF